MNTEQQQPNVRRLTLAEMEEIERRLKAGEIKIVLIEPDGKAEQRVLDIIKALFWMYESKPIEVIKAKCTMWNLVGLFLEDGVHPLETSSAIRNLVEKGLIETNLGSDVHPFDAYVIPKQ